jgi:lipid-A-disaccharide synthase
MLKAASLLGSDYEYLIPLAPTLTRNQIRVIEYQLGDFWLTKHPAPVTFVRDARAALHHARASIVASGTATVEAALIGNPFVVVYRVSPLTYAIAKRVVKVPHVAMVNLVAEKRVIPELIQSECTAANIVREIMRLLPDGPPRQSMMLELARIRGRLQATTSHGAGSSGGAIARVAQVALELIGTATPAAIAETVPH